MSANSIKLAMAFDAANGEFLKFDRIEKPRHTRRDIAAFLLLDELVPGSNPIVSAAEHDEVFSAGARFAESMHGIGPATQEKQHG